MQNIQPKDIQPGNIQPKNIRSKNTDEVEDKIAKKIADVRTSLLEFSIIKMLIFSRHPLYGREILEKLAALNLPSKDGTVYPLLSKLRRDSLLESSLEESDLGPPRKYYFLTTKGKKYFTEIQKFLHNLGN